MNPPHSPAAPAMPASGARATARTIDVQAFLNGHPFSAYQWLVFALCTLVVLLDGFDTAAIGFIAPSLTAEWGIGKPDLGPVLSAALFGLAIGALVSGPLSDRFGRRLLLNAAVFVMGIACLASAWSGSLSTLVVLRFVTGLGLGAAMPNAVTMMSEHCPDSRRSLMLNLMFCGFPLGAAAGGFLSAWMIPQYGWRSVLVLGGVAPLLLLVVMIATIRESVRYMATHGAPAERIRDVLRRIHPDALQADAFVIREGAAPAAGAPAAGTAAAGTAAAGAATGAAASAAPGPRGLALIFSAPFRIGTVMVWIAYFMGLVIFYSMINWMPILFREAGVDAALAARITAVFSLGGVGAIAAGYFMDRGKADWIVAGLYLLTAALVAWIGQTLGSLALLVVAVLLAGIAMNTAQTSMPALAAAFYPTAGRGSGVAWMMGVGRFGGIAGSLLVAELTRRQMSLPQIFTIIGAAGLVAAAALVVKALATSRGPAHGVTGR